MLGEYTLTYQDNVLSGNAYFIMGQICVDKPFRADGVFYELYKNLERQMSPHYDYCITSVDDKNQRSLKAHLRAEFKIIKSFDDTAYDKAWHILLLDLREIAA